MPSRIRVPPRSGEVATGELAARIKNLAIALDPEWTAQRYASATRERNVIGYLNEDGTAPVTGWALASRHGPGRIHRTDRQAVAAALAGAGRQPMPF